jgi:cytochrome c553
MKKSLVLAVVASAFALNAQAGGNVANGKALTEKFKCAACHGADFNSPIDPSYPKLAGQHATYLEHALVAYKRADAGFGRNNPIMAGQAKPLSDSDVKDVAAYLHSLPCSLVLKK